MTFSEDEFLQLSGLQHFAFCRRQWALIHIELQWSENWNTTDGELMHKKVHDSFDHEYRGEKRITRGMYVHSYKLGISGQCDVVEFIQDESGVPIEGWDGSWQPYPIEYKRGKPFASGNINADELQLCAQAMCLEEMLLCDIRCGYLFYGEIRRRHEVVLSSSLRQTVRDFVNEMHELYRRGATPLCRPKKACGSCSLNELCLPKLMKKKSALTYMRNSSEDFA